MSKGPAFAQGNARRHEERLGRVPLLRAEAERLSVELSVQAVRDRGGLSYEERIELKRRIAAVQRPKETRERIIEDRRRRQEAKELTTGPGLFLCGCDPNSERLKHYYSNMEPDGAGGQRLTNKRRDAAGHEVCPIHGKRLYGHLSQAYERRQPLSTVGASPGITDQRDLRDPAVVGQEWLDRAEIAREAVPTALSNGAPIPYLGSPEDLHPSYGADSSNHEGQP